MMISLSLGIGSQTQSVILLNFLTQSNSKCVDWPAAVIKTPRMENQTQKFAAQLLFARNMKRIRLEKKLTQEQVAEAANLHPNYISSVERGERNLSIANIERIAFALGTSMPELLTNLDRPNA